MSLSHNSNSNPHFLSLKGLVKLSLAALVIMGGLSYRQSVARATGAATRGSLWSAEQSQQRETQREVREGQTESAGKQKRESSDAWKTTWTDGSDRIEIRVKNAELTEDGTDVKSIAPGGYFVIESDQAGTERQLKIVQGADGKLKRSFFIEGSPRPYDAEAQAWAAKILLDFARQSDHAAENRVKWLYKQGGLNGVLREISEIKSELVKRVYFGKLLGLGNLDSAAPARVLEQATREINSTYELSELLIEVGKRLGTNSELRPVFFKTLENINSDYERRRVLTAVIKIDKTNNEVVQAALQSARSLTSDFELAELLIEVARLRTIDDQLRPNFMAAVKKMQSSYEQGRVLIALTGGDKTQP